jgi:RNA polymerase sigma factor (sigma-70 family)
VDTANLSDFFRRLTRGMAALTSNDATDRQLVERALAHQDEAALQAIVYRHGAMVYRVCWRVLQHSQDTEDAFQATFLVLAEKLRLLRKRASLASWLHGIAYRVARRARAQAEALRRRENQASLPACLPPDEVAWGELRAALDFQLSRLPDKWRLPLVLCYLEGRTQDEAAGQLGWSKSTLRRRLEKARGVLGSRLKERGLTAPTALAAVLLADCLASAGPAFGLVAATVEAANGVVAGKAVDTVAAAGAVALTKEVLKTMFQNKLKNVTAVLLALLIVGALGWGLHAQAGAEQGPTHSSHALAADGMPQQPSPQPADKTAATKGAEKPMKVQDKNAGKPAGPDPDFRNGKILLEVTGMLCPESPTFVADKNGQFQPKQIYSGGVNAEGRTFRLDCTGNKAAKELVEKTLTELKKHTGFLPTINVQVKGRLHFPPVTAVQFVEGKRVEFSDTELVIIVESVKIVK